MPPGFRLEDDTWSRPPLRLLAGASPAAEALRWLPVGVAPPGGLSAMLRGGSLLFIAAASWQRARRAEQFQLGERARRYAARRAGLESAAFEWVAVVSLPSLGAAAVASAARVALPRVRWAPFLAALAAAPALLAGSAALTHAVLLEWALRPALDAWMPAPSSGGAPQPPPEDLLLPPPRGASAVVASAALAAVAPAGAASLCAENSEDAAVFGELDALTQRQIAWALDGSETSSFPEATPAALVAMRSAPRQTAADARKAPSALG